MLSSFKAHFETQEYGHCASTRANITILSALLEAVAPRAPTVESNPERIIPAFLVPSAPKVNPPFLPRASATAPIKIFQAIIAFKRTSLTSQYLNQ